MSARNWAFVALMLGLTAVFGTLGIWQWQRLGEKEALIAAVNAGLAAEPVPIAEVGPNPDYQRVSLSGTYEPAAQVPVFTNLSGARGPYSGPGYWMMTALVLDEGGTVFVNRGFVPQNRRQEFPASTSPTGHVMLNGVARAPERANAFTPAPSPSDGIDWVRDPERLAFLSSDLPDPLLPFTVDLPAGAPGELPQGGETVVEFPNNHLGYAVTWFGFAVITPILLFSWLRRQRHPAKP